MNLQSKFGNCINIRTLIIALFTEAGRNYGRTDRRTDIRMDDPITRCPRWTFQAGGIKILGDSRLTQAPSDSIHFVLKFKV